MIGPTPAPQVFVDPTDGINTLRTLNARASTLRKPLTQVKNLLVADNVKNFDGQGALYGGWPGLSPETAGSGTPLVKTGTLRKQLGSKSRGASGGATGVKGTTAWAGAGAFYGRFHQAGAGGNRRGTMPKREIVGITDRTREKSLTIISQYLTSL